MASAALQTQVAELYTAFFNRAPDAAGFQFWLSALDSGRLTLDQMKSDWWSTQAETALKYPATLSVSDFVEQIYTNVLGRASDASGKAFWSDALTNGSLSRENCIQNIIDATKVPSATGPDTQYLANKAAVGVHFAQSGNNDGLQAVNIVKIVTSDSASVDTAKGMIDGTTALNGTVMDGYINGATVFLDSNFNGKLDAGEASTTTNTTGGYSLAGGIGQLVSTGGIDITTNAANKAVFTSSMGSTIISPVSTLVAQKMADGASIEVAQTAIKAALGITSNINLSTINPLSVIGSTTATDAEKSVALKLQAANVQVNNILSNAVSALTGAGETMDATKLAAVMSSAAGTIAAQFTTAAAAGTVVNLSSASFINTVLTGVASTASSSTIMASMNTNAQSVANVLADNNTKIDTQVSGATASTLTAALGQIGKIQEVVQDSLSAALASGTTNMATITSTYTGAAADTLFSNATIGSFDTSIVIPVVTPPASTPAPTPDTTAPTVILTYSVDGGATYTTTLSAKDADTLKIKATFSEAIADGTGATIAINNSILSATAMTKVSTTIYTYDLNVPVGNIAIATVSIGAAADASGNVISTTPANADFAVDNTAPASLAAITLDLDTASDTGTSTSDDLTSDATPAIRVSTLNGILMTAGDIIRIVDTSNADAVVGSYTVLSGDVTAGAWNGTTKDITLSTLSTGAHALKVQLVDAAGNTGTISTAAVTVTIDTTASTTTVGSIDISADTGSATDFTTLTAAQTITGTLSTTLVAGEVLNGSVDGGSTWTNITTKASGTAITWDGATLSGSSSIKIKVTDAAGNDGTVATQAYVLDTTVPTAPTGVAVTSVGGTVVANTINGTNTHLTAQATITAGQATGGSAVLQVGGTTVATDATILVGDTTVTFTTSDGTPTTAELQAAITAGGVVTVTVTDVAGNTSTSSVSNPTLVRDIVAPAAHASPISGSDMGGVTGYGEGDLITLSFSEAVDVSKVIVGNLALSAHSLGTSPTITPISPASGYASVFRIQLGASASVAAADTITLTAGNVVDAAGNPAAGSVVFTVPAITAPVITRATTAVQTLTGTAANDVFIAVGVTAAGQYTGADANFADLTTINSNVTSEINSSDVFNGNGGYNVLHVYGTADLTGVTLTDIQKVVLHSDVTFTTEQMSALNTAGASIVGDGVSIMRMKQSGAVTSVDMSAINLQAIGQFDLAQSLTAQIDQLGLNGIGTVAAGSGAFIQAKTGTLDFNGKTVYGLGSIKDSSGTLVSTLDAATGVGLHLNTVVTSVASLVESMNTALAAVPGYATQDVVNLDVASMSLYLGSQTEGDVIMAGSNHAFMRGGGFVDTIIGGSGTNFISGAAGNDTITGGAVRDFIAGDEGNDTINGLGGNDFINSQGGDDIINGGAGLDFIMPGDGADTITVTSDPDFISLYSSTTPTNPDSAADTIKFMANAALTGGPSVIVGFEAANDVLKFESTTTGAGITGISAAVGNATISAAAITGFNMNTTAPGGILILTESSFIRGDAASANHVTNGYDAVLSATGTTAGAGVGHLIAVGDGGGNTNIFYDNDGSTTANNWQLAIKLIGVAVGTLTAATALQLINEQA